jgi:hypothetical protein
MFSSKSPFLAQLTFLVADGHTSKEQSSPTRMSLDEGVYILLIESRDGGKDSNVYGLD